MCEAMRKWFEKEDTGLGVRTIEDVVRTNEGLEAFSSSSNLFLDEVHSILSDHSSSVNDATSLLDSLKPIGSVSVFCDLISALITLEVKTVPEAIETRLALLSGIDDPIAIQYITALHS